MLETNYRLYQLSDSLNWAELEKDIAPVLGNQYASIARLVCGSVYLKSFFELSTSELIDRWPRCPYFRYFCGENLTSEGSVSFPIPHHTLDRLTCQLNTDAHDAMIKALQATSDISHSIH